MRSKKFKFLLGALIIALVVSILPMGILANAVKEESKTTQERKVKLITKKQAEEIAIEAIKEEGAKSENLIVTHSKDDTEYGTPQYYFRIVSPKYVYFVEVHARTSEVLRFVEILREEVSEKKPDKKDEEKAPVTDKKEAIAEFQTAMKAANQAKLDNKDDFHKDKDYYKKLKKDAIEEFKKAKDEIKKAKKDEKNPEKKDNNNKPKEEKKPSKKDEKPINEIKYLTEKKIKEIAIDKFKNKNIKPEGLEIELKKDKNPPIYIIEAYDKTNKIEYELKIHATTGIILEYERALD